MLKHQDIIEKANEDFVQLKARMLTLGKEKIFQQSEKIEFAKRFKRMIMDCEHPVDNHILHILIDMENIYDVFFDYYKSTYIRFPNLIDPEEIFLSVIENYKIKD